MAKLPEGRSTMTDEQMIGLTHRLVDTCIDCKGRIEELEAKLAKAVEALHWIGTRSIILEAGADSLRLHARMILAELKEGKRA